MIQVDRWHQGKRKVYELEEIGRRQESMERYHRSEGPIEETATVIECAIAANRKALNWRAVFSSHCIPAPEPSYGLSTNKIIGSPLKVPRRYTQHDENTARQFTDAGNQGSITDGATPGPSHLRIAPNDAPGLACLLGDLPFPLPLHFGDTPYSPHFTPIGSQDADKTCTSCVAVKKLPAFATPLVMNENNNYWNLDMNECLCSVMLPAPPSTTPAAARRGESRLVRRHRCPWRFAAKRPQRTLKSRNFSQGQFIKQLHVALTQAKNFLRTGHTRRSPLGVVHSPCAATSVDDRRLLNRRDEKDAETTTQAPCKEIAPKDLRTVEAPAYLELLSAFESEKLGSNKGDTDTRIKCAIAPKRNALN
ncbi:hypothetical protein PR048_006808 [Dryococelus australis]|uniref:Uncharacterized protein n=1 Tax=Dryococelus australis TaxID=614101 RepID=A0ABQ9IBZ2_9NEOP|nr:hypothetical protein PR048_006808 [Dryococelus australis]